MSIDSNNFKKMKTSYGYLYLIENKLRDQTKSHLERIYGVNWTEVIKRKHRNKLANKSIENLYFHELISLISMVLELNQKYERKFISDLKALNEIRNKIAHCNVINESEYEFLLKIYHYLDKLEN